VTIKKTVRATSLPGVHPGLMERIREAEKAELEGEAPRKVDGPQKIVRPPMDATTTDRLDQVRTIGLIQPALHQGVDPRDDLAEMQVFLPGTNLDEAWDNLSESQKVRAGATERFRLELETALRRGAAEWTAPHQIGGRLDARNLDRLLDNLKAELAAYRHLLADDAFAVLTTFVEQTRDLVNQCLRVNAIAGVEAPALYDILRDWVQKLVYQELVSRERAMGDRGLRRVCANVELADQAYLRLKRRQDFSPRQQLLMRLVHVHQDIGYTAYAARKSYRGTKLHRAYGARIFTDEINRYRALFTFKELEEARFAVATHSAEELPFQQARLLGLTRAVDHLAPLTPHRVYSAFEPIGGALPYLERMLVKVEARDWDGLVAERRALAGFLIEAKVPTPLRDDLLAAFRPFERLADPVDLGDLGGQVVGIDYDWQENPGALTARVALDPFAQRYQVLFDCQQDQLLRLAKAAGVTVEALRTAKRVSFQLQGHGALVIQRV